MIILFSVISSLVKADYVPDILEKRGPHRPGHIALAQAEEAEGKMLLGGAWGAPVDGALFIWLVNSADGTCALLFWDSLWAPY